MKRRKKPLIPVYPAGVTLHPARLPIEAAVLPARERCAYGALAMVPWAYDAARMQRDQRAKIWVR